MTEIIIKKGNIIQERVDAIVNPANSYGFMSGGVAYVIKNFGGKEIEEEAIKKAPIKIGDAIITTAGKLQAKFIIHAPTMEKPAMKTLVENVIKATYAALKCADKNKLNSIAFPGMGTGVGCVRAEDAAIAMISTIRKFLKERKDTTLKRILLIAYENKLFNEFEKALRKNEAN
ncbi:MAG: macro domain-containing protein [Candidatus Altiarchaeota archaeon]